MSSFSATTLLMLSIIALSHYCVLSQSAIAPRLSSPNDALPKYNNAADYINQTFLVYILPSTGRRLVRSISDPAPTDPFQVVATIISNVSLEDLGWDYFSAESSTTTAGSSLNDADAYYNVGYGEGWVTHDRIAQVYPAQNYTTTAQNDAWLQQHVQWMQQEIERHRSFLSSTPDSLFWKQLDNLFALMRGIADGFNNRTSSEQMKENSHIFDRYIPVPSTLTLSDVFRLNFGNEISDVQTAQNSFPHERVSTRKGRVQGETPTRRPAQHCSALIRLTPTDLYIAHDTWGHYIHMVRQHKTYKFPSIVVSMTSFAGFIASGDDWYLTSNGLVSTETTNGYYNNSLAQEYIRPETVSEFLRVMVANFLAINGDQWMMYFSMYHSGTYCNQWMVLDYKLFTPGDMGGGLRDGLLWVAEELPGRVTMGDMTEFLRNQSFWSSYNIPFFPNVYVQSGFAEQEQRYGEYFSYQKYSRALIFKRNVSAVMDLSGMQSIMRYNNWKYDSLSLITNCTKEHPCLPENSPWNSIAARGDLVPPNAVLPPYGLGRDAFGAYDSKITSYTMAVTQHMQQVVILGPTYDQQPVFSWSTYIDPTLRPPGAPDRYKFPWVFFNVVGDIPSPTNSSPWEKPRHVTLIVLLSLSAAVIVAVVGALYYRAKKRSVETDAEYSKVNA